MAKRILNRIRLDKIAAVDKPCQEFATAAIVKRAPGDPAQALAKVTFTEALEGAMVADKVNEAFWRSFDGLWQRNDAFRRALTDELASGGDGATASADYIASVDALVEEAVTAARSAGAKASDADIEKAITDAVTSMIEKSQPKELPMTKITTKAQLKTAAASFTIAKSTVAEMNDIVEAAVTLDAIDELPAGQTELVAAAKAKKENPFPPKKEEDDKEKKSMKREIGILKLAPDAQAFAKGLADDDARDSFLAKSADEQKADIEKASGADPVVYTTASGLAIRKSDGAVAAVLAKQADEQAAELVKLRGIDADNAFEKRARSDFPNVALTEAVDLLKSAKQVGEDTATGKSILKTLTTMNKGRSDLFKTLGTTEGGEPSGDIQKARGDFNGAVQTIMKRDSIDMADAMTKARSENPDLFAEAYPDTAEASAE